MSDNVCPRCAGPKNARGRICGRCRYSPEYRIEISGARFESKIEKTDGCWIWRGTVNNRWGYGQFAVNGVQYRAHRYSYNYFIGKIADGMSVCHSCDNKLCVNPGHLWLGTQKENIQDMCRKGRSLVGEKNPMAKIKKEDVLRIRQMYLEGCHQRDIASFFGLNQSSVSQIILKKRWAWLT